MIRIADLDQEDSLYGEELCFDAGRWAGILETLRAMKALDDATLDRMASPVRRVEVTEQQARAIGNCLARRIELDLPRSYRKPPPIPSYIVPIATSNGLWIDPALPLLNRRPPPVPGDLGTFVIFCFACKGFAVN